MFIEINHSCGSSPIYPLGLSRQRRRRPPARWCPGGIVAVFDGNADREPRFTRIHRYAELPLNYLGYQVDYLDLSRAPLPAELDADVAAVLVWFDEAAARERPLRRLGGRRRGAPAADPDGLRMVAFGDPGLPLIGARSEAARRLPARVSGCAAKG